MRNKLQKQNTIAYSLLNKAYRIMVISYSLFRILTFGESEFGESVYGISAIS